MYSYNIEVLDEGAVTLVVDLAKAFGKVQLKVILSVGGSKGTSPSQRDILRRQVGQCGRKEHVRLCGGVLLDGSMGR